MRSFSTFFVVMSVTALILLACATTRTAPPAPTAPDQAAATSDAETTTTTEETAEVAEAPAEVAEMPDVNASEEAPAVADETPATDTAEAEPAATEAPAEAADAAAPVEEAAETEVAAVEGTAPAEEPIVEEAVEEKAPSAAPDNADIHVTQAVVDLIKQYEGLRLEAYVEGDNVLVGYGHAADVEPGTTITEEEAETLLREDLQTLENSIKERLTVPVNANELSAMVSLAFNIGLSNFSESSVLKLLNDGKRAEAADAFLLWNKAGGEVNDRLVERRQTEREIFLTALTS